MPEDRKQPETQPGAVPGAGEVAGAGLQFAAAILVFLFAGYWLDERLGTTPWLLIAGVFAGAAGGFYSIYRRLVVAPRKRGEHRERTEKES